MDSTTLFNVEEIDEALIKKTLQEVYEALDERGHNPINQLVGYLLSGDPGYISSHLDARSKISKLERSKIIESLVKSYFRDKQWDY